LREISSPISIIAVGNDALTGRLRGQNRQTEIGASTASPPELGEFNQMAVPPKPNRIAAVNTYMGPQGYEKTRFAECDLRNLRYG
jgi:hypothetical protein